MMRLYFDPMTLELFDERNRDARELLERGHNDYVRNECKKWMHRGAPGRVFRVMLPRRVAAFRNPSSRLTFNQNIIEIVVKDRRELVDHNMRLEEMRAVMPKRAGLNLGDMVFKWRSNFERKHMAQLLDYCKLDANMFMAAPVKPPLGPVPDFVVNEKQEKRSRWIDGRHFIERLERRGFQQIGAGAYSTVLAKPGSDRVIKVSRQLDNWIDYVVWAAKRGHAGKFAPVVHSYRMITDRDGGTFYVAVVERLKATLNQIEYSDRRTYRAYMGLRAYMDANREDEAIDADRVLPGSLRFAMDFKRTFKGRYDLHANNWMVRKDGSVVCTDPLCQEDVSTSTPRKMRRKDFAALSAAF